MPKTKKTKKTKPCHVVMAKLADKHGITIEGTLKFPELWKKTKYSPEDINPIDIRRAHKWAKSKEEKLKKRACKVAYQVKWNGKIIQDINPKTGSVPDETTPEQSTAVEPVKEKQPDKTPATPKTITHKRKKFHGHTLTAVIRALGSKGWEFEKTAYVFNHLDLPVADNTIKIQLKCGSTGDLSRGEPATLTKQQWRELKKAGEGLRKK